MLLFFCFSFLVREKHRDGISNFKHFGDASILHWWGCVWRYKKWVIFVKIFALIQADFFHWVRILCLASVTDMDFKPALFLATSRIPWWILTWKCFHWHFTTHFSTCWCLLGDLSPCIKWQWYWHKQNNTWISSQGNSWLISRQNSRNMKKTRNGIWAACFSQLLIKT